MKDFPAEMLRSEHTIATSRIYWPVSAEHVSLTRLIAEYSQDKKQGQVL